jgi:hypothetical protein
VRGGDDQLGIDTQSFFRAFLEEETKIKPSFHMVLYGGATRLPEEGVPLLRQILASSTTCKGVTEVEPR